MAGGIVRGAISGIGSHSIEIVHDSLTTEIACTKLNYYLHQCVGLLYVKMSLSPLFEQIPIFSSMNIEDLGRIVFRESRTPSSDSLLNKEITDRHKDQIEEISKILKDTISGFVKFNLYIPNPITTTLKAIIDTIETTILFFIDIFYTCR